METIVTRSVGRVDQAGIVGTLGRGITSHTMAVAELIDNAIASKTDAIAAGIHTDPVQVIIRFQDQGGVTALSIRDTSTGMSTEIVQHKLFDYARRNEAADSLNEFGVGAKEALGYLAGDKGKITLKTTHTDVIANRRTVSSIQESSLFEIYNPSTGFEVRTRDAEPGEPNGTLWTIHAVKGGINVAQQEVLFRQLGSMYRRLLSLGDLIIKGEDSNGKAYAISYESPKLLRAYPMFGSQPDFEQPEILWKVDFNFDWTPPDNLEIPGGTLHIEGWLGCLEEMKKEQEGIAIIRRGRVVQMGGKAQWMPAPKIFKNTGSHLDKRLVGELICDQIPTTKIKSEVDTRIAELLADALRRKIDQLQPKVLKQAEKFRRDAYKLALAEWQHDRVSEPSQDTSADPDPQRVLEQHALGASSPASSGASSLRERIGPIDFGHFTNPIDSSTFTVELIASTRSASLEWKWSTDSDQRKLAISVSKAVFQVASEDTNDEPTALAIRLVVALALLGRQGGAEAEITQGVIKLAENLVHTSK